MFDYLSEDDFDPDGYSEDDIEAILGRIPDPLPAYDTKKPQEEKGAAEGNCRLRRLTPESRKHMLEGLSERVTTTAGSVT